MGDENGSEIEAGAASLGVTFGSDYARWLQAPYFQRRYCWNKKTIEDFLDDLVRMAAYPSREHFIGACVLYEAVKNPGGGKPLYWVIDGQQRLTTSMLALLALHRLAPNNKAVEVLIRDWSMPFEGARRLKVIPTLEDTQQLFEILETVEADLVVADREGPTSGSLTSGFVVCQRFLERWVSNDAADALKQDPTLTDEFVRTAAIDKIARALSEGLSIVEIQTPRDMDSTQVFQSINGKGQKLTVLDLIRSMLAMKFGAGQVKQAQTFFRTKWTPFEKAIGESSLEDFLFVFALQQLPRPTKANIYPALRDKWSDPKWTAPDCLRELEAYVPAYIAVVRGVESKKMKSPEFKGLRAALTSMRQFAPPSVARSYLVRVVYEALMGEITPEEATKALGTIEAFLVRRAVIGYEPTGLHTMFMSLWDDANADPDAIIDNIRRRSTLKSPGDDEIRAELAVRNFYATVKCRFVLYEWERSCTTPPRHFDELLRTGSIDHIMPQKSEDGWDAAGPPAERERTLNLIGNLVLIESEENSSKGTESWAVARKRYQKKSRTLATKKIADAHKNWTTAAIDQRTAEMADWICEAWPDEISE